MIFSSSIFLLYFFPLFLVLYYLCDPRYKNGFALAASFIFFSWGAPLFVFVVAASILLDYFIVLKIERSEGKRRKRFLVVSVILNVGLLAYFKYSNFFVENINNLVGTWGAHGIAWTRVALPIGISFFTFKKLSYCIDVYRGTHKAFVKIRDYALFIMLFPELIAGPIVRFNEIADQIIDRRDQETIDNKLLGLFRFVIGLSKKVLIANVLGAEADKIFALEPTTLNTPVAWIGILAYTFQIYFDFSGYSDMAIGIAKMIGFKFPENFDNPYISQSITEFWRRWHITLGRWMRDYLYIPLGGNKVGKGRLYFNLVLVFFLSGLWHGASWTFVVWGCFHGLFLIADRIFLLKFYSKIGRIPSAIITFVIVVCGWVFFRSENLINALHYLRKMFAFDFSKYQIHFELNFPVMMMLAAVFSFWGASKRIRSMQDAIYFSEYGIPRLVTMSIASVILFILSEAAITSSGFNPFIYYRF
ncbi:MAG: MBOAT family O-acyltransferase [Bacteroidia bacterium]